VHRAELEANWVKMKAGQLTFLPSVVQAAHRGGFRLCVVFNDGTENTIDFAPWLEGPMFEALKSPEFFAR
jgi:hypothetical protein